MHDRLQNLRRRVLGCLQTKTGAVLAKGGAEFDEDGRGFFIPESGTELAAIPPGQSGLIETPGGQTIAIQDLGTAPSTASLPRRYTFTYRGMSRGRRVSR